MVVVVLRIGVTAVCLIAHNLLRMSIKRCCALFRNRSSFECFRKVITTKRIATDSRARDLSRKPYTPDGHRKYYVSSR